MDTRNGASERLLAAVAVRPAAPGLLVVIALLAAAVTGWRVTSLAWFWPTCTVLVLLAVALNTLRQDVWRRVQGHEHRQRMVTANDLLNDHLPVGHPAPPAPVPVTAAPVAADAEISGSIRELGGLVERFGHKLDDLLAEVHTEKSSAEQRSRRS